MRRAPPAGRIILAPAPNGTWMFFEGMARAPQPSVRWLPSIETARSFAIAFHQAHGWSIEERNEERED